MTPNTLSTLNIITTSYLAKIMIKPIIAVIEEDFAQTYHSIYLLVSLVDHLWNKEKHLIKSYKGQKLIFYVINI